jgi:hypothetical protein
MIGQVRPSGHLSHLPRHARPVLRIFGPCEPIMRGQGPPFLRPYVSPFMHLRSICDNVLQSRFSMYLVDNWLYYVIEGFANY